MANVESRVVHYDDADSMTGLLWNLTAARVQFAVCPWPNDLKDSRRTGWLVTWPKFEDMSGLATV